MRLRTQSIVRYSDLDVDTQVQMLTVIFSFFAELNDPTPESDKTIHHAVQNWLRDITIRFSEPDFVYLYPKNNGAYLHDLPLLHRVIF